MAYRTREAPWTLGGKGGDTVVETEAGRSSQDRFAIEVIGGSGRLTIEARDAARR